MMSNTLRKVPLNLLLLIGAGLFVLYTAPIAIRRGIPVKIESGSITSIGISTNDAASSQNTALNANLQSIVDAIEENEARRERREDDHPTPQQKDGTEDDNPKKRSRRSATKSMRVVATDLDTRDLSHSADSVRVWGTDGSSARQLKLDSNGHAKVNIENTPAVTLSGGTVTGTVADGVDGSAVNPVLVGGTESGGTLQAIRVDSDGKIQISGTITATNLDVALTAASDSVTVYGSDDDGTTKRVIATDASGNVQTVGSVAEGNAASTNPVLVGAEDASGNAQMIQLTAAKNVKVDIASQGGGDLTATVAGSVSEGSSASTKPVLVGAEDASGNAQMIQLTAAKNVKVDIASQGGGDLTATVAGSVTEGSTASTKPVLVGAEDVSGNAQMLQVTEGTRHLQVDIASQEADVTIVGSEADGANGTNVNPVLIGGTEADDTIQTLRVDSDGHLQVDILNTPAATVAGSVGENSAAIPNPVLIGGKDDSGNVQMLQLDSDGNVQVDIVTDLPLSNSVDTVAVYGNDGTTNRVLKTDATGNLNAQIVNPLTAFGELRNNVVTPVVQLTFQYGVNTDYAATRTLNSASTSSSNGLAALSTGTNAAGFASLTSRNFAKYRAGEGILARFTALWPEGCSEDMESVVGVGDEANGFFFGCNGANFGVLRRSGGLYEIRSITISGTATVATTGTIDVTLDGVTVNVDVFDADDAETVAARVAAHDFSSTGDGWDTFSVGATVYFIYQSTGDLTGSFAVALTGVTGVTPSNPSTEVTAGADSVDTWHAQTSWNVDSADGNGVSGLDLNISNGNVFQIQYAWLGFGAIHFYIETPAGRLEVVHRIVYSNSATSTSITQPSNPFMVLIKNTGATSESTVKTPSAALFVEGGIHYLGQLKSYTGSLAAPDTTDDPNEVLSLQNGFIFNSVKSRIPVIIQRITFTYAGSTNSDATFYVRHNPTASKPYLFTAISNSPMTHSSVSTSEHTVGTLVFSSTIAGDTSITQKFDDDEIILYPGDVLGISVEASSSNTAAVTVSWKEDI